MLKSLRYRLLNWFVLSTLVISVLAFSLFQIYKSSKDSNQVVIDNFQFFKNQFLKDQNQIARFLSSDIYETNFYITGESNNLNEHYQLISNIDSCFVNFYSNYSEKYSSLNNSVHSIRNTYTNYCIILDSLVYNLYQRGFQDYGLEGKLSSCMYALENSGALPMSSLTFLKVSEREYLYRYNTDYIETTRDLCENLKIYIASNGKVSKKEKDQVLGIIDVYLKTFNKVVYLDKKIGLSSEEGLKYLLAETGDKLEKNLDISIQESHKVSQQQMARLNYVFGLTTFLLIAISFALCVYTSRFLVKHLEQLTTYISSLAKTNFNQKVNIDLKHSTSEIRQIYKAFRNMLAELRIREKQRNLALRYAEENQQRYRDLSDLLPQCIYETDRVGNLTYVNEAWYNTFGYTKKDILKGINLIKILNADPQSSLFGYSKIENNDYIALRSDGSKFPATVYSDVIRKGVRVIGRRGIIIDVTLRNKYIETLKDETLKAQNSDKHKSSFLANMSHEIRTPMNSIIGFSNMLSSKEIPEEDKENFIDHIQSSSEMLLNLVDDIIDVAKIEAGQLKIQKGDCTPKKLISELAENFHAYKERLEKLHIVVKTNLPEKELNFRTDEFRLKQILTNLLSNAIKFTEEGSVEVGVKVKNQRMLEFYVEDTGIGMTQDELRTIFERFKRSKLSEEKNISGTGLGLAISKNLVEMLGGNMWVSSKAEKGTKFSFELPYIRVISDNSSPEIIEEVPEKYEWLNKTILIAEDDDNGFSYLSHILNSTGVSVIRAKNGIEAVKAMSFHKNIDLILMDLQMPELNGLQATEKIKETHSSIPIIAQTAFAMEDDRTKCLKAGCDDYITKPLLIDDLLAKIAQFISPVLNESVQNKVSSKQNNKNVILPHSSNKK